jgi:hypothetical protein
MLREVYLLPKVDNTLGLLDGATIFSKLDANSGFWQILLTKSSQHLTTFITPFGRFQFNKLPFGISSAPEHFQCWMNEIFTDQEGVLCHMDDILIFGQTQEEHDARLRRALQTLESAGVTLNPDKCKFSKTRITFLGMSSTKRASLLIQRRQQPPRKWLHHAPPVSLKDSWEW